MRLEYQTQAFVVCFRFPWRQLLWIGVRMPRSEFWNNVRKECIKHQIRVPVEEPCSTKIYFRPTTSPKN